MTYQTGQLIVASDFNGFATSTNNFWSTGTGNSGWGQTSVASVSTGNRILASDWSTLVTDIQTGGNHTGATVTSMTTPVTGAKISVINQLNNNIANVQASRGNAVASGTTSSTWTGTAALTAGITPTDQTWTITWTTTVDFASANAARYFFNAGGLIRIDMSKTSTGRTKDTSWNNLIASIGTIYISGGINGTQTIAGVSYTGASVKNNTGSPTGNTAAGWYYLLDNPGTQTVFQQNQQESQYASDYVRVNLAATTSSQLTVTVIWYSPSYTNVDNGITGGTATASPFSSFGTAPAVVVRCVNPSTTYLTNTWGTPTVSESVSSTTSPGLSVNYLVVAGGGSGGRGLGDEGGGGGGAGGLVSGSVVVTYAPSYAVTVGLGGKAYPGPGGGAYNTEAYGGDSSLAGITATGGGYGGGYTIYGENKVGGNGGSGGGGCGNGGANPGGTGIAGQGNNGGTGAHYGSGGGGGGAGSAGATKTAGSGSASSITGASVTYATGGTGGDAYAGNVPGAQGVDNTGNGGGGGGGSDGVNTGLGGNGGSGVVIISYDNATQVFSGGTVTSYAGGVSGTVWVHKFTSSGTITWL